VYQQAVGQNSDLKLYRMDRRTRVALPAAVNTRHWEWRPRISGPWLLFARISATTGRQTVVLFNRRTRAQRVLAAITDDDYSLVPGQIEGNWLVWSRCAPTCDAFLYNISSRAKTKLAKPSSSGPVNLWAPGVTRTGVVYVGQGPEGCGNEAKLVRYGGPGDPATGTPLIAFPDGFDFNGTNARSKSDGTTVVYYARATCVTPNRFDVYRITDPPPP
jgi:hypothetical protein